MSLPCYSPTFNCPLSLSLISLQCLPNFVIPYFISLGFHSPNFSPRFLSLNSSSPSLPSKCLLLNFLQAERPQEIDLRIAIVYYMPRSRISSVWTCATIEWKDIRLCDSEAIKLTGGSSNESHWRSDVIRRVSVMTSYVYATVDWWPATTTDLNTQPCPLLPKLDKLGNKMS